MCPKYRRAMIVVLLLAVMPVLARAHQSPAEGVATARRELAPQQIGALTPADVQIAWAREAAPADVSSRATIMVLKKDGYEVAVAGSNGFTCAVLHDWPDTLAPTCYDAEGSRTLLVADLFAERLRARGVSQREVTQQVDDAFASGRLKAPQRPGIVYMLSPRNRVYDPDTDKVIAVSGHLMFYAPYATAETVGTGKGAPHVVNPGKPYTLMLVVPR